METNKKLLAHFAFEFSCDFIHVLVSAKDERARHFYALCGFEFLGKCERKGISLIQAGSYSFNVSPKKDIGGYEVTIILQQKK